MQIHDITQTIHNEMPVWPGDPEVSLEWLSLISEGDDVNLTQLRMCVHTGTHIDMPSHFLANGKNLNDLDLSILIGSAKVISVPPEVKVIDESFLKKASVRGIERILFKTSNSAFIEEVPQCFHQDFVALDESGAKFLAEAGCKLAGIDTMSIAVFDDPVGGHLPLLEAGIVVLEGLSLKGVAPGDYHLIALPMKLGGREGTPVRAILVEN
jgi:arylformamidase